ncbi:DUF4328 domain-containing protein [Streptomyces sp. B6B3]|uniref:DUF4328 domain-containing protein n=1 Tax=Streptomyces sp. B6B3 TaxID=3153570 RepID=UPI00325EC7BA
MTAQCWSCRQRPATMPDGRCQTCAGAPVGGMPPQAGAAPQSPYPGAPPQGPYPGTPPQGGQQPYPGGPQPYPGQQPYPQYPQGGGGAYVPPAQFNSPQGLAKALTVLLTVSIVVFLITVATGANYAGVLGDVEDGTLTSLSEYDDAADTYSGTALLGSLAMLATGIVFIIWFHRTRVNAEVFDAAGQRKKRGWAIGGWFVPIVNLWFPKQIANDVWRASAPYGPDQGRGVLNAWWTLWIISLVASSASFRIDTDNTIDNQEELDAVQREVNLGMLSDLVGIAAAILAILFVRRLTARQLTKYQQGPAPQQPGQYPGGPGGPGPMPPAYGG